MAAQDPPRDPKGVPKGTPNQQKTSTKILGAPIRVPGSTFQWILIALGATKECPKLFLLDFETFSSCFVRSLIARQAVAEGVVDPAAPSSSEGRRLCPSMPEGSDIL